MLGGFGVSGVAVPSTMKVLKSLESKPEKIHTLEFGQLVLSLAKALILFASPVVRSMCVCVCVVFCFVLFSAVVIVEADGTHAGR